MCLPKLYSGASTASRRPHSLDRLNRVHSGVANTDSVTEQNATKVIRALAAWGYSQCQRQKAQKQMACLGRAARSRVQTSSATLRRDAKINASASSAGATGELLLPLATAIPSLVQFRERKVTQPDDACSLHTT